MYICVFISLIAFPLLAMQQSEISQELKTRKLCAADFKALGVEYVSTLRTHLDRTKIIPQKKFSLPPDQKKWEPLLEKQQKEFEDQINQQYQVPLYLKYINDKVGFGVFAGAPIKEFDTISEYTGYLCVEDEHNKEVDPTFSIDVGNYYASDSAARLYVNGKLAGNFARFINHSYIPNVHSLSVYNTLDGLWHVMMHAKEDIPQDAQLLINYGPGYWQAKGVEPVDLTSNP